MEQIPEPIQNQKSTNKILLGIMIILIILIVIITFIYIEVDKINNIKTNNMLDYKYNNIQASHIANLSPYILSKNNQGMGCFRVDEWGNLWGSSMQPTFFEGNTVLMINYSNDIIIHSGDMLRFFRFSNTYPDCESIHNAIVNNSLGGSWINNTMAVIHRVNAIYDDTIVMQGDNLYETETIHKCQITDIVVGILFT